MLKNIVNDVFEADYRQSFIYHVNAINNAFVEDKLFATMLAVSSFTMLMAALKVIQYSSIKQNTLLHINSYQ